MPTSRPERLPQRILSGLLFVGGLALVAGALWRWEVNGWATLVWLVGFIAMGLIRAPYAKAARANAIADDRKTLTERLLLGAMWLTMVVLPLVHLATGVFAFADYALPVWARATGATLLVPFLWLFWRSHGDLGRNWSASLEIREEHGLVTGGVYDRVRHPMYAAIWLGSIAQALLIQNWIAGFLVLVAFAAMYLLRTPREEAMMRARFGAAYDIYAQRTGRIFPRLGKRAESSA
jgi:protein-S-isoprenylcysteine O-methyltransferase Ste14